MSRSPAVVHSFLGKARLKKKELQGRKEGVRGNIHLFGKAKLKKWE